MKTFFKSLGSRIAIFFAVVGPGFITANAGNDAGGITTYSVAGASFGLSMLWTMIPLTIGLVIIQEMSNRMGVVTGKGLSGLIRERFGIKITFYISLGTAIGNLFNTMTQFAGIAAGSELLHISKYITIPFFAVLVWIIVLKGNYKSTEKVFLVGCFFFICYIISGFIVKPDISKIISNLVVPKIEWRSEYLYGLMAVLGTTIAPWMQFYHQSSAAEKGTKIKFVNYGRFDAASGATWSNLTAGFIIVVCATVLYQKGLKIEDAKDAALALRPLAGDYCYYLFAFGLLNSALLAACIIPLSAAFNICEGFGWEDGVGKTAAEAPQFYIIYTLLIVSGAGIVLLPQIPIIKLMIFSQVINGLLLPFVTVLTIILASDRRIMNKYANSTMYNIMAWVVCITTGLLSCAWVGILIYEGWK